jgi:hypothetical protein
MTNDAEADKSSKYRLPKIQNQDSFVEAYFVAITH